jgi:hypothetical protein
MNRYVPYKALVSVIYISYLMPSQKLDKIIDKTRYKEEGKMRKWMEPHFDAFVAALTDDEWETLLPDTWAKIRATWAERGFPKLTQQKNLLGEFRRELKAQLEGEDLNLALAIANFTPEEWDEANAPAQIAARKRNENQLSLEGGTINTLLTRATNLLASKDWLDIAAGLLVVTGRRPAEVLKTASFESCTDYSVQFRGAVKRRDDIEFEIPTLCKSEYVINALEKLRSLLDTTQVPITDINNSQYTRNLADRVRQHFGDILDGNQKNLSSDDLRPIYTRIAIYFYCPPQCDEDEFAAHLLGHFDSDDSKPLCDRRIVATNRPYKDYAPIENGKRGTRLDWRGVEILAAFQDIHPDLPPEQRPDSGTPSQKPAKRRSTTIHIWYDQKPRWKQVLEAIAPPDQFHRSEERTEALLNWIEGQLKELDSIRNQAPKSETAPEESEQNQDSLAEIVFSHDQAIAQLSQQLQQMKQTQAHTGDTQLLLSQISELEAQNAVLKTQNAKLTAKLDQFRQLLNGNEPDQPSDPIPQPTPEYSQVPAQTLHKSVLHSSHPPISNEIDPIIVKAIHAIMAYNNQCDRLPDKWAISYPVMKDLLAQVGKASQPKIKAAFDALATEIREHHSQHNLGKRHNRSHQNEKITDFIALDN